MKKKICYLMTMAIILVVGFSSCSSDPDPAPAKDISGEYTGTKLLATNDGEIIADGIMKIVATDATNAKITLSNIVNGHASFEISSKVIATKDGYSFEAEKSIDGMKVSTKGTVIAGKAVVNVTVQIIAPEIIGAWSFSAEEYALVFQLLTKSGNLTYYGNPEPMEMNAIEYSGSIEMMGSSVLGMALTEFTFNFQSNGYVGVKGVSTFSPAGEQNVDIAKLARYYYNPKTKVLTFDAPLGDLAALTNGAAAELPSTMQVPFVCTFNEEGAMQAVLSPEFTKMLVGYIPEFSQIEGFLSILDDLVPDELKSLLPWIKGNIKTLVVALTDKNNFDSLTIGLRLEQLDKTEK